MDGEEFERLRCQIGISKGRGGRRHAPFAFTEQGVAMLSRLLGSPQAVAVNIEIMRAFVRLREMVASHTNLARRLDELKRRFREHDEQFAVVFDALRQLMEPPQADSPELGYHTLIEKKRRMPDLQSVIAARPTLLEAQRDGILATVKAASSRGGEGI
jgi:hypothetical protein